MRRRVKMEECHICGGSGEVMHSLSPETGPDCHDCEACDGTGEIEEDAPRYDNEWDYSKDNPENWDEDMYGDRALQER